MYLIHIYSVKSAEPVLAAIVGTVFYNKAPSFYKVCCLPIIVGGVAFASLKKGDDGNNALEDANSSIDLWYVSQLICCIQGW